MTMMADELNLKNNNNNLKKIYIYNFLNNIAQFWVYYKRTRLDKNDLKISLGQLELA
jgi:hypothetical protein